MDYVKKNKLQIIVIAFILLLVSIIGYLTLQLLRPLADDVFYGNRLDGISKVAIKNDTITALKTKIMTTEIVESFEYFLHGKIINILIVTKDEVEVTDAKELSTLVLESFSEGEKNYYDIQMFLSSKTETAGYPAIGYKHRTALTFVWSNNSL